MTRLHVMQGILIGTILFQFVGNSTASDPPANDVAADVTPKEILENVASTYASMKTYKANGTITSEIDTGTVKMTLVTSFSILLKKPNLYLISWTQQNKSVPFVPRQSGAVWSDGAQPYLFMGVGGMNSHAKMRNDDEMALGAATGISGGVANTIPSYFLPLSKEMQSPSSRMIDPKIEAIEKVGEEECYVIGGPSPFSKREAIWVSKSTYLIKKYFRSLEPPKGGAAAAPELTDDQIEESLKGLGQKVTDESKKKMKAMMKDATARLKAAPIKGSSTEIHLDISTADVTDADFQFMPPADSVLKESLFDGVLGGKK